jgi:hypothetical protein
MRNGRETWLQFSRTLAVVALGTLVLVRGGRAFAQDTAPVVPSASTPPAPSVRTRVPLDLVIDKSKVDLAEHHLELRASRDLERVTIKVVGDSGAILADDSRDLGPQPAGKPLVVG